MNKIIIGIGLVSFIYSCLFYHNFIKNKNNKGNNDNKDNKVDEEKADNELKTNDKEIIKEEVDKIVNKVINDRKVHFDENWIEIKP